MRPVRCCLWPGICASVAVGFSAAVTCLMGAQFLARICVQSGVACTRSGYKAAAVTGNLCEHGDGLMRGGCVLFRCSISSLGKREGRIGVFGELLHGDSPLCDLIWPVSVARCFVDGLVRGRSSVSQRRWERGKESVGGSLSYEMHSILIALSLLCLFFCSEVGGNGNSVVVLIVLRTTLSLVSLALLYFPYGATSTLSANLKWFCTY